MSCRFPRRPGKVEKLCHLAIQPKTDKSNAYLRLIGSKTPLRSIRIKSASEKLASVEVRKNLPTWAVPCQPNVNHWSDIQNSQLSDLLFCPQRCGDNQRSVTNLSWVELAYEPKVSTCKHRFQKYFAICTHQSHEHIWTRKKGHWSSSTHQLWEHNGQKTEWTKFRSLTSDNMEKWKSEQRSRVTRKKIHTREMLRKSRMGVIFFMIRGSGGSKRRVAKAAGAELAVQHRNEKLHAAVARSTFVSQNVQNTAFSDHFLKFRCRKWNAAVAPSTFTSQNEQKTWSTFWGFDVAKVSDRRDI